MKIKAIFIIVIILTLVSCKKSNSDDFKSKGIILGPDLGMCICCGGYKIKIDTIIYNFDSVPKNSNINVQKEIFPLPVKLDWNIIQPGCANWIKIQKIRKE